MSQVAIIFIFDFDELFVKWFLLESQEEAYKAVARDTLRSLGDSEKFKRNDIISSGGRLARLNEVAFWLIWCIDVFGMISILVVGFFYTNVYHTQLVFGGSVTGGYELVRNGLYLRACACAIVNLINALIALGELAKKKASSVTLDAGRRASTRYLTDGKRAVPGRGATLGNPLSKFISKDVQLAALEICLQMGTCVGMALLSWAIVDGIRHAVAHNADVPGNNRLLMPAPINDTMENCLLGANDCASLVNKYLRTENIDVYSAVPIATIPFMPWNQIPGRNDAHNADQLSFLNAVLGNTVAQTGGGGGGGAGGGGRHGR